MPEELVALEAAHGLSEGAAEGSRDREPDTQRTDLPKPRTMGRRDESVRLGQSGACLAEQGFTRFRQCDAMLGPLEKCDTEFSLQALDALGQRRLRHAKPLGCPAEVQLLADGDEMAQLTKINHAQIRELSVLQLPTDIRPDGNAPPLQSRLRWFITFLRQGRTFR